MTSRRIGADARRAPGARRPSRATRGLRPPGPCPWGTASLALSPAVRAPLGLALDVRGLEVEQPLARLAHGPAGPLAVGVELPRRVLRAHRELDVLDERRPLLLVDDRDERLGAAVEVAVHAVGAADVHDGAAAAGERVDARVLQEAAQHGAHADVLAQARDAGTQRADAAHREVHLHACLGGAVEGVDRLLVDDRVELHLDPRLLAGAG